MADVFLSYKRRSSTEFCSFLCQSLTEEGYEVFFDVDSLRSGNYDLQIEKAIAECRFVLVVLAPDDLDEHADRLETDWLLHEVGLALELGKTIIPVSFRPDFHFPKNDSDKVLSALRKLQLCDVSGPHAAKLIKTRLLQYMHDSPAVRLREEYAAGIKSSEYQNWEIQTLQGIYGDLETLYEIGRPYPAVVVEGSSDVLYPFDSLCSPENLISEESPVPDQDSALCRRYRKVIGSLSRFSDLYGFSNEKIEFDPQGKVSDFRARLTPYSETVYSSHILHYELWSAFQRLGKDHPAALEDLPLRKRIHSGKSNHDVLFSGCNRSSLCGICTAVLAYDEIEKEYSIALATRSSCTGYYPGYLSLVPSGGFELFELKSKINDDNIRRNFRFCDALFRTYLLDLFNDEEFLLPAGNDDLKRLYRNSRIKALQNSIGKTSRCEFLGLAADLITLRPSFAFMLRIDDPDFLYGNQIRRNDKEYDDLRFVPLSRFEKEVLGNENRSPLTPESAGVYRLLKQNPLFREICRR